MELLFGFLKSEALTEGDDYILSSFRRGAKRSLKNACLVPHHQEYKLTMMGSDCNGIKFESQKTASDVAGCTSCPVLELDSTLTTSTCDSIGMGATDIMTDGDQHMPKDKSLFSSVMEAMFSSLSRRTQAHVYVRVEGRERLHPSPPHPHCNAPLLLTSPAPSVHHLLRCHPRGRRLLRARPGECVVTNPPFSRQLPRVLAHPCKLGKPFVVIMPCSTPDHALFPGSCSRTSRSIVPRHLRHPVQKLVDGVEVPSGRCSFDANAGFLLATRVAEGRGVLDVMAVSTLPSKMRLCDSRRRNSSYQEMHHGI